MSKKTNKEFEDFFPALAALEREKGISEEAFLETLTENNTTEKRAASS